MLEKYQNNYEAYFNDQMTTFRSFESKLYASGIAHTINHLFPQEIHVGLMLDLCCGDGTTTFFLKRKGFHLVGCDGSKEKLDVACDKNPDTRFLHLDVNKDIRMIGEKFHYVYASHCFEHFLDPLMVLVEARTLLMPGGIMYVIVPYPNTECEGHPGSGLLALDKSLAEVTAVFESCGWKVLSVAEANFREPELIITLQS